MAGLTAKQEAFVQGIADGKSPPEAYRLAYDCENSLQTSINTAACQLQRHPKIAPILAEMQAATRAKVVDQIVWTRLDSIRILQEIAEEKDSKQARIAAIKELNAMAGFNAPVKSQMVGADGQPVNLRVTVNFVQPQQIILQQAEPVLIP